MELFISPDQRKYESELSGADCLPLNEFMSAAKALDIPLSPKLLNTAYRNTAKTEKDWDIAESVTDRYGNSFALVSGSLLMRLIQNGGSMQEDNLSPDKGVYDLGSMEQARAYDLDPQQYMQDVLENRLIQSLLTPNNDKSKINMSRREIRSLIQRQFNDPQYNTLRQIILADINWDYPKFDTTGGRLLWEILKSENNPRTDLPSLPSHQPEDKYGNCSDSETYFSYALVPQLREAFPYAYVTVITDQEGNPLILQKTGSGMRNRTGITLIDTSIRGIFVPAGTLVGIESDNPSYQNEDQDQVKSAGEIGLNGVFPLRLSIFAVPPDQAEMTFQRHYKKFLDANPTISSSASNSQPHVLNMSDIRETADKLVASKRSSLTSSSGY